MRLLFVSNLYPPYDIGGYEKHCREVTEGLCRRGHHVQVLTSRHGVAAPVQEGHIRHALFLESNLQRYEPIHFFTRRRGQERCNASEPRAVIASVVPDAILFWGMWNLPRRLPAVASQSEITCFAVKWSAFKRRTMSSATRDA
jgi:glycogen(starch) synthase